MAIKIHDHESATNQHRVSIIAEKYSEGIKDPGEKAMVQHLLSNPEQAAAGLQNFHDRQASYHQNEANRIRRVYTPEGLTKSAKSRIEEHEQAAWEHADNSLRRGGGSVEVGPRGGKFYVTEDGVKVYLDPVRLAKK